MSRDWSHDRWVREVNTGERIGPIVCNHGCPLPHPEAEAAGRVSVEALADALKATVGRGEMRDHRRFAELLLPNLLAALAGAGT